MSEQEQTKRVAVKLRPTIIDALRLAAVDRHPAATSKGQVTAGTVIEELVEEHLPEYVQRAKG